MTNIDPMASSTKAWITLSVISLALIFAGHHWAGRQGLLLALMVALSINSVIYFYFDRRVLEQLPGRQVEGQDPWGLLDLVEKMARKARLPLPRVIVLDSSSPQALALGRSWNHSTVMVTAGLLRSFTREELEAVVAYQLASIKRLDTLLHNVGGFFAQILLFIAHGLDHVFRIGVGAKGNSPASQPFAYLLAPIIAFIFRISAPSSHYLAADALAANWLADPKVLAQVLWKLQSYSNTQPLVLPIPLAAQCMVTPLTENGWARYLRTQPTTETRIKRLVGHYPI
jgi:heat shock protein HtpX